MSFNKEEESKERYKELQDQFEELKKIISLLNKRMEFIEANYFG